MELQRSRETSAPKQAAKAKSTLAAVAYQSPFIVNT